jgi:phospholipase C
MEYERRKSGTGKLSGNVLLKLKAGQPLTIIVRDNAYGKAVVRRQAGKKNSNVGLEMVLDCSKSFGWYDFSVQAIGFTSFEQRFAGHVETGVNSRTDPAMGER